MTDFNETHKVETFKSVLTIGMEVLRALILINGGAAAGMVATLDKLRFAITPDALQTAMLCFVIGLITAVLAGCAGYFTQYTMHEGNMGRTASPSYATLRKTTVTLAFMSLAGFSAGALSAAFGLR
jgi:hypothetical protein